MRRNLEATKTLVIQIPKITSGILSTRIFVAYGDEVDIWSLDNRVLDFMSVESDTHIDYRIKVRASSIYCKVGIRHNTVNGEVSLRPIHVVEGVGNRASTSTALQTDEVLGATWFENDLDNSVAFLSLETPLTNLLDGSIINEIGFFRTTQTAPAAFYKLGDKDALVYSDSLYGGGTIYDFAKAGLLWGGLVMPVKAKFAPKPTYAITRPYRLNTSTPEDPKITRNSHIRKFFSKRFNTPEERQNFDDDGKPNWTRNMRSFRGAMGLEPVDPTDSFKQETDHYIHRNVLTDQLDVISEPTGAALSTYFELVTPEENQRYIFIEEVHNPGSYDKLSNGLTTGLPYVYADDPRKDRWLLFYDREKSRYLNVAKVPLLYSVDGSVLYKKGYLNSNIFLEDNHVKSHYVQSEREKQIFEFRGKAWTLAAMPLDSSVIEEEKSLLLPTRPPAYMDFNKSIYSEIKKIAERNGESLEYYGIEEDKSEYLMNLVPTPNGHRGTCVRFGPDGEMTSDVVDLNGFSANWRYRPVFIRKSGINEVNDVMTVAGSEYMTIVDYNNVLRACGYTGAISTTYGITNGSGLAMDNRRLYLTFSGYGTNASHKELYDMGLAYGRETDYVIPASYQRNNKDGTSFYSGVKITTRLIKALKKTFENFNDVPFDEYGDSEWDKFLNSYRQSPVHRKGTTVRFHARIGNVDDNTFRNGRTLGQELTPSLGSVIQCTTNEVPVIGNLSYRYQPRFLMEFLRPNDEGVVYNGVVSHMSSYSEIRGMLTPYIYDSNDNDALVASNGNDRHFDEWFRFTLDGKEVLFPRQYLLYGIRFEHLFVNGFIGDMHEEATALFKGIGYPDPTETKTIVLDGTEYRIRLATAVHATDDGKVGLWDTTKEARFLKSFCRTDTEANFYGCAWSEIGRMLLALTKKSELQGYERVNGTVGQFDISELNYREQPIAGMGFSKPNLNPVGFTIHQADITHDEFVKERLAVLRNDVSIKNDRIYWFPLLEALD